MRLAFGNGAVKIIQIVPRDIKKKALRFGFGLRQTHRRQLRLSIGHARQDAIIGAVFFEGPRQRIHAGIPSLVTAAMGKLLPPRDIARA